MNYPDKELHKQGLIKAMSRFNLSTVSIVFMWPFVHCVGLKRNELFTEEGKIRKRLGFLSSGIMIGIGDNIKGERAMIISNLRQFKALLYKLTKTDFMCL